MAESKNPVISREEVGWKGAKADTEFSRLTRIGLSYVSDNRRSLAIFFDSFIEKRKGAVFLRSIGCSRGYDVVFKCVRKATDFVPLTGIFLNVELGDCRLFDVNSAGG